MNDARDWAISYLAARGDVPWRWADDGDVITWADGTTIAFRNEVAAVLDWLVPHTWPPFGALVWLLAACRGKLPPRVAPERMTGLPPEREAVEEGDIDPPSFLRFRKGLQAMHAAVEDGLAEIARLPEEVRTTVRAKATLAEKIFGTLPGDPGKASLYAAVVDVLRSGVLTDAMLNDPGAPPPESRNEWLALHEGLKGFSADALVLRARTGLDELPQAPELPEISSERVRALIAELRTDAEHAGLARLARDFMAALQLPRRLAEPDEMPIGGFADLSNRGNLDRLLLSELGHDDLTLAVRIALNEALYLRREPPAKQPPSTLAILIDSGVRLWGVPRVLATAVGLALIAKSGRHEELAVYRASRRELIPVDLLTRAGLIAHLGVLEPHAHPGLALNAFSEVVSAQERAEAVLITHRDVLADAEFQRSLAAAKFAMLYLAVVDREGGFELLRYPAGGAPICQARVNVEDLWPTPAAPAPRRAPLIDRTAHPDLPASFFQNPFPLLIAVRGAVRRSVIGKDGSGLCVMKDRRLLRWGPSPRFTRGARTVAWSLPRGRTMWLGELSDGRICVVKAHGGCRQVFCRVYSPDGVLVLAHDWQFADGVSRVDVQGECVILVGPRVATVRSLSTGQQLGSLPLPRQIRLDRYFVSVGPTWSWSLLVWDGVSLSLAPVTLPTGIPRDEKIIRIFDRDGFEGPWFVMKGGGVYSHEGRRVMQLQPVFQVRHVSESGNRLVVITAPPSVSYLVDLVTMSSRTIGNPIQGAEWEWKPPPPSHTVLVRFDEIAIGAAGTLYLHARSGKWYPVGVARDRFLIRAETKMTESLHGVKFEPVKLPAGSGFSLGVATWPDGRCAWLDSRGMLHLRCADRSLPELSIVLSELSAVWSSDGLWMGNDFFVGEHPCCADHAMARRMENFCEPAPVFPQVKA